MKQFEVSKDNNYNHQNKTKKSEFENLIEYEQLLYFDSIEMK